MNSLSVTAFVALLVSSHQAPPSADSPSRLQERSIERRAVEAVIWGMPAVNFDRMLQAAIANGAKPNQVVYWSRPVNWKNQTLTPNPDTIYLNPFYDTRNGPVVLEIPASGDDGVIVGSIDDAWQNALEDVGIAGVDKGKGGKYLITPPDHKGQAPDGYIVVPSDTYQGFIILRSNFKSRGEADIKKAAEFGKRIKMYPLGASADSTVYVDVFDKPFDATIPYDVRFFESLDRFVQVEPWLARDKVMIEQLGSLGIWRGKSGSFKPDAPTKSILESAAKEARDYVEMLYERGFAEPFFPGARWGLPVAKETVAQMSTLFSDPSSYGIEGRAVWFSIAYFCAKHLGEGQFYLLEIADKAGHSLSGSKTYRLSVPAHVPVKQYWSATVYDRQTHALIKEVPYHSRGSNVAELQKSADGATEIYFGPAAPQGKESNWVPTHGRDFEILFRFYGPEKALFDKTWTLPDVEEVK